MAEQSIEYYCNEPVRNGMPVVVVPSFGDEGQKLWQALDESGCGGSLLAAIPVTDWEGTLSPWPAKKVFKGGSDFGNGADSYLEELTGVMIPEIRKQSGIAEGPCFIAGYSFAGLFALYSLYKSDVFSGAASVSGSLWFPGFTEFAMSHELRRKPDRLYLSLGDRESSTRNEIMKTVGEKTELLYQYYQSLDIPCIYESNPGNHFQDPEKRLAKGIRWLLDI